MPEFAEIIARLRSVLQTYTYTNKAYSNIGIWWLGGWWFSAKTLLLYKTYKDAANNANAYKVYYVTEATKYEVKLL